MSLFHKGKSYLGIQNITLDLCKLASGEIKNVLFDMVTNGIEKYGNIMQPCPRKVCPVKIFIKLFLPFDFCYIFTAGTFILQGFCYE